jgi:hypothetical protein
MIEVRTLLASDPFPEGFQTGYEHMPVMKSWVWVAEEDGDTAGVLMAAPMHGLIYLMRICIHEGAPPVTAFRLLRACMRDSAQRGFRGFFMHVDPTGTEAQRKLIPLVKRAKGVQMMIPQIMLVGSLEAAARF